MSEVKAMGGTELILAHLKQALPELTDQVQIIMSRPEQVAHENKPRILWLQDLPQDPASACLKDASYRTKFNRIVFASNWQQQMYNIYAGIPYAQGTVIKNGVPFLQPTLPKPRSVHSPEACCDGSDPSCKGYPSKLKFVYTSTPHRGLAILAAAAEQLATIRQDWELHVYSSLNIYGLPDADKQFEPLYDLLRKNPCVVYHGSVPNAEVRQAVLDAHVFVYPSIYQETSCMAVQEALMAGCIAITTNLAALIETCGEWAWMIPFTEDPNKLVEYTLGAMHHALTTYDTPDVQAVLRAQVSYYQNFYAFESRIPAWEELLKQIIAEGAPVEKLVIGRR